MLFNLIIFIFACSPDKKTEGLPTDSNTEKTADSPTKTAQNSKAQHDDAPPPAGKITGDPILPTPVVLGGIDPKAVDKGLDAKMEAIKQCFETERQKNQKLAGKVLVKFKISQDGSVSETLTKATSLRNKATEECLNQQVSQAKFPELKSGKYAIVNYPFTFPTL